MDQSSQSLENMLPRKAIGYVGVVDLNVCIEEVMRKLWYVNDKVYFFQ
jgi:hypothetical protein